MDPGAYRNLIRIERVEVTEDEIGNPKEHWETFCECYAYMNGLSGKEYWEAANVQQENTVEFKIRWKKFADQMNTKQFRIVFRGEMYDIKSIDNVQYKNRDVKIKAVRKNEN